MTNIEKKIMVLEKRVKELEQKELERNPYKMGNVEKHCNAYDLSKRPDLKKKK